MTSNSNLKEANSNFTNDFSFYPANLKVLTVEPMTDCLNFPISSIFPWECLGLLKTSLWCFSWTSFVIFLMSSSLVWEVRWEREERERSRKMLIPAISGGQPEWVQHSAETELPTIGSHQFRGWRRGCGGPGLLLRWRNQPGGGSVTTESHHLLTWD